MFTGIIEETGKVRSVKPGPAGAVITVDCEKIKDGLGVGDSVAVNGVCLSVTDIGESVSFDAVKNTLAGTNLKKLRAGSKVNLENAMKLGEKVSGHMVSGHVDGSRRVIKNASGTGGWVLDIATEKSDKRYLVPKGSVAVDGVSLTVGEVRGSFFRIFLIPITLGETTLKSLKPGDHVNIEFDTLAKYAEKRGAGSISEETLRRTGFMK